MPDDSETAERRARKKRQRARYFAQIQMLKDALDLVHRMSCDGSNNDPAVTLRNINAVTTSAITALRQ